MSDKPMTTTRRPNVLEIEREPGVRDEALMAKVVLKPELGAASNMRHFHHHLGGDLDLMSLIQELKSQAADVVSGKLNRVEEMLVAQAHTLDAVFNKFATKSAENMAAQYLEATETYMRMALRAQNQCRMTLETLATIKNPPVIYARQANVTSGPQQINNGIPSPAPTHAAETESPKFKVLEQHDGEWLDTRAQGATSGTDKAMATLGEVDRTEHAGRQSNSLPKRGQGRRMAKDT